MGGNGSYEIEEYRRAELRLRLLLLGDGMDSAGLVKGEESRGHVTTQLRHMREAISSALEAERGGPSADTGEASLEEALRRRVSAASASAQVGEPDAIPSLLTPAESAQALGVSVGSIYKAIRDGEIRAVRLADRRGALRVPSSELERKLVEMHDA